MSGEIKRNCHRFECYGDAVTAFNSEERANAVANYKQLCAEWGETEDAYRMESFIRGWFEGWLFSVAKEARA